MSSGSDRSDVALRSSINQPNKYISAQDLVAGNFTLAGFLRKRGPINRVPTAFRIFAWSQRYVVLHQGCLYTYKSEVDKKPAGAFSLYGYNTVYTAGDILASEAPWAFKISHMYPEFKTYYFSAACEQDEKEWIKQIKVEMLRANNKLPKRTSADGMSSDEDQRSLTEDEILSPIYEEHDAFVMNKNAPQPPREDDDSDDDYSDHIPTYRPHVPANPNTGFPMQPGDLAAEFKAKFHMKPTPGPKPKRKPKPEIRTPPEGKSEPEKRAREPLLPPDRQSSVEESFQSPTMPLDPAPRPPEKDYWSSIYYTETAGKSASELIRQLGEDGVFLVRDSDSGGYKVLVVFANNMPKKFKIENQGGKFYIQKDVQFDTLEDVIYHYHTNDLPCKICLNMPYWEHPKYQG